MANDIRFTSFPRTQPPAEFVIDVTGIFQTHLKSISTTALKKGLKSDKVLAVLRSDLVGLGFEVEAGKRDKEKIKRPVFFGENGKAELQYEIDAYHPSWKCGLEVEAGRAWMGNAVYRDLIQALVMVELEHLILALPISYKYMTRGRQTISRDYENSVAVADALYGHSRIRMPFGLTVIGY